MPLLPLLPLLLLLPLLAPLGGAVPFGAPLLGDFSGELAGFGDSAGLGDSGWVLASLGLGDSDSSDLADGVFNKFSSSGRGWPSRPLSGRRVWIGRTGVSPWVSFTSFSVPAFPTGPEKPLTRPSKHISKTVVKDLSKHHRTFCYHSHWVISKNASRHTRTGLNKLQNRTQSILVQATVSRLHCLAWACNAIPDGFRQIAHLISVQVKTSGHVRCHIFNPQSKIGLHFNETAMCCTLQVSFQRTCSK